MTKIPGHCDRCCKPTNITTGSMFDTDMICMDCKQSESQHPRYSSACYAEMEQVKSGNMNFRGIGLPDDLKGSRN